MDVIETGIPGLIVIEPVVLGDDRGFFMESWNSRRYEALGIPAACVPSNVSRSGAGVELSAENHRQMYVPEGFAHGFCVLSESVLLSYFCTEVFHSEYDAVIAWNDHHIDINWPVDSGRLSAKDASAPRLRDISPEALPRFVP